MGFQIEICTGEEGKVTLRGCSDGTVEFCKWTERKEKDKETGEITITPYLEPYKFYADASQAFSKIARMRIGSSNATSLQELVEAIKQIRLDIKKEMGIL
jgi:hypothetical protein